MFHVAIFNRIPRSASNAYEKTNSRSSTSQS
jgi:hypothetical protein